MHSVTAGLSRAGRSLGAALLVCGLLQAPPARADEPACAPPPSPAPTPVPEAHYTGFGVSIDQDVFLPPAEDKDYTMGVQFEWRGDWVRKAHLDWPVRGLDHLSFAHRGHRRPNSHRTHSFRFGDVAFTPQKGVDGENLARTDPLFDDRPYANLLYVQSRRSSARGRWAFTSDFMLGVLGLRVGEKVQSWIHEHVTDDVKPGGWRYQISDGGELTAKYHTGVRWLAAEKLWDAGPRCDPADPKEVDFDERWFDLVLDVEGSAGNYTNLSTGGRVRLGLIDSPYWGGDRLPLQSVFNVPGAARSSSSDAEKGPRLSELYLWASGGATWWFYNGLLQGQFADSVVTLGFDDTGDPGAARMKRLVGDFQVGVTARFRSFSMTYAIVGHSALFGGPRERTHGWGTVTFSFGR